MLYFEDRNCREKSFHTVVLLLCHVAFLVGCGNGRTDLGRNISMEAFSELRTPAFSLAPERIRIVIDSLCYSGEILFASDKFTRSYYLNGGKCLWIDRLGVTLKADTLLKELETVGRDGFIPQAFYSDIITLDLERVRNLNFDNGDNSANVVLARLEFYLTKAYLRYVLGMRFGFTNPYKLFNRLDTLETDSGREKVYRKLFDLDVAVPTADDALSALDCLGRTSVHDVMAFPVYNDSLYEAMRCKLRSSEGEERSALLCNMERCRWRDVAHDDAERRYVLVNIPAFHLYAFDGDLALDMKTVCGTRTNKTPLLSSCITRMDVNPVWNIPVSIIKKEISHRAGDTAYFSRNNYYVVNRKTQEAVGLSDVTEEMLRSGEYRVLQKGGEGNSLGRIIFRFPNDFSVYLHDTPTRRTFNRDLRSASHGCVRIERPFEFAEFLLGDADEWTLDKLRISMGMSPVTQKGLRFVSEHSGDISLVRSLSVKPCIPIYITYYTVFPDACGKLAVYPDVYGYDDVIYEKIKPIINQVVR